MLDFVVAGVPVAAFMVVLVEVLKRLFKIEGDGAIVVAVAVGVLLSLANQATQTWPTFALWYHTVAAGVILGFMACGLFDAGQAIKTRLLK